MSPQTNSRKDAMVFRKQTGKPYPTIRDDLVMFVRQICEEEKQIRRTRTSRHRIGYGHTIFRR